MKKFFCALLACMLMLSVSALAASYDLSTCSEINLQNGDILTGEYSGNFGLVLNVSGDTTVTMQDCSISSFGGGALKIHGSGTLTILQEGYNQAWSMSGTGFISDVPLVFAGSGSMYSAGSDYPGLYASDSVTVTKGELILSAYPTALKCQSLSVSDAHVMKAGDRADSAQFVDSYSGERYVRIYEGSVPSGDGADLMLWTVMLAVASAALVILSRRKQHN